MAYGVLQVDVGYDMADIGGLSFDVVETGGNSFTTAITTGLYFLRTDASAATGDHAHLVTDYDSLIAALQADFRSQGDPAGEWTITFNTATRRVKFAHDGGGSVTGGSITTTTGGDLVGSSGASHVGGGGAWDLDGVRTPHYYIDGDVGYWASWDEYETEPDAMVDVEAHDGTPHGIAPEGVASYVDMVIPNEPRAKVHTRFATAADPFTWRDVVRHARNIAPLAIYDGVETHIVRLRKESARWKPRARAADYVGHYDVPLMTRLLGRL